jgi:hypothetical protein
VPRIDNAGTFRKSANSGTTFLNVALNNYANIDIQTGTLHHNASFLNNGSVTLAAGTTHRMGTGGSGSGTFNVPATALVEWTGGTFTLNTGAQLNGTGPFRVNGVTLNCNTDVTVQNLELLNGTFGGSGAVTISNSMTWTSGTMSGTGRTIIAPGATLSINNIFNLGLARTLENGGTTLWTGGSPLYLDNAVITNRPGALFHVQNAVPFHFGGGTPRFDNAGTFRKSANSGTTFLYVPFNNYGTTDIRTGILAMNGDFTSSSSALLNCALGGTSAGTGYGQLQKSGTITLNGSLSVELLPGFTPATNDAFTVVSAGTRNLAFSSFAYPSNLVTMQLSNTTSSVIVRVTGVLTPIQRPTLFPPEISGTDFKLTWSAISNTTYRLEFNPDLSPSNWTALPGDVIGVSNTASKLDTLTASNRFYRVRVLP